MICYEIERVKDFEGFSVTEIAANIEIVKQRISAAAQRSVREAGDITLVAVTKTHTVEMIDEALRSGITYFGENKVQEALEKLPLVSEPYAGFHFIGHLQTNKVKTLLRLNPCLIHSVDSYHLASALSAALDGTDKVQEILLQVNTSGETSKYGIPPFELPAVADAVAKLPNLKITGLMTISRLCDEKEDCRQDFRLLKALFENLRQAGIRNLDMQWLSMGMTDDFEIAIEEGANIVRIGSAIFGERNYY